MDMDLNTILKRAHQLAEPYRVGRGKHFKLKSIAPDDTGPLGREDKPLAVDALTTGVEALGELQTRLYAQDRWALLLVFQAIDAAGKDSAIKHVMSGVNPQGCQVFSFKAPSSEDLDHDFLWRSMKALPERGRIGIFNRSYYEELTVVRVHPEILERQKLPQRLVSKHIWTERAGDIRNFEEYLSRNGVVVRKFFLHVSADEQRKRFMERLDEPDKNWKFSIGDLHEREYWDQYQEAYEDAIRSTATDIAPWYVVPADCKWFTRIVVAAAVIDALGSLDLHYPEVTKTGRRDIEKARKMLASKSA
jgi:PPK2 family polyphosphate:nucleotide phosphotransferase